MSDTTTKSRRLISRRAVQEKLGGISPATVWRRVATGQLPKPVKIAANRDAWPEDEIDAIVAALIASRDEAAA